MTRICPMTGFGGNECPHLIKCGSVCRKQAAFDELPKTEDGPAVIARWRAGHFERYVQVSDRDYDPRFSP